MKRTYLIYLVQVLELVCTREAGAVFEAGGLNCVLTFIRDSCGVVHKDTLHSAMSVVSRLCSKMEPQDPTLPACVQSLSVLLRHEDSHVCSCSHVALLISYFSPPHSISPLLSLTTDAAPEPFELI
jgi:hypothetical protein